MNVVNITHRVSSYMDRVSLSSPPVSIPYLDALHRKNDVQVENREELFNRVCFIFRIKVGDKLGFPP